MVGIRCHKTSFEHNHANKKQNTTFNVSSPSLLSLSLHSSVESDV